MQLLLPVSVPLFVWPLGDRAADTQPAMLAKCAEGLTVSGLRVCSISTGHEQVRRVLAQDVISSTPSINFTTRIMVQTPSPAWGRLSVGVAVLLAAC